MEGTTKTRTRQRRSGQNSEGDFDRFTDFMRRLVRVPHSEIKKALDAERRNKTKKDKPKI